MQHTITHQSQAALSSLVQAVSCPSYYLKALHTWSHWPSQVSSRLLLGCCLLLSHWLRLKSLLSPLGSSGHKSFLLADCPRFSLIDNLSFIGVLLVSLSDNSSPKGDTPTPVPTSATVLHAGASSNPLLGDILATASAMGYAFYVILLKVSSLLVMIGRL